ncbi:ATP-dependent dethiobiotin synthetase BioD [Oscillatoriales cyanobacterium LEGE 11467]|uniref:ATP-dependent dethiobiotin synthetase BioD n=1 Tax=Zarconia navalis LEGE 11467 TaxID=1828826 RepID=A0A928Z9M5_9CYAN|nr:dethiobiotin synthase [Zarconia navalis]MBE9040916.1 ATP-dependent dethiobiotin synthetase BioD [Zarconia navalis LEGE 11467]
MSSNSNALLIAGTDTEVGKTVLTSALLAYWQRHCRHRRFGIFKPIQSGTGDRELYDRLFDSEQTPDEITPLYFQAPLAPPVAARREGRDIDLGLVWRQFRALSQERDWVFMEALGGLGSPVTDELTVADLARDWRLPTVLVVPVKLGAIAQAVANSALARQENVSLVGIVLNCTQPRSPEEMGDLAPIDSIEQLSGLPVLGCLPHLADPTNLDALAIAASNLDLERLGFGSVTATAAPIGKT